MLRGEFDVDVDDENLTGFASNVTGAAFVLTANSSPDGLAHQVSIRNDTANNHAGKTVTLVGTDSNGKALTEVVTGPGVSATVESAGYFKTLTSATPSATIGADTFDIGWVDEVSTQAIPINWRSMAGATINVDVTGTINFTVQETFDAIQTVGPQAAQWVAITALSAKTADTTGFSTVGATAIRLLVNSYSSGAELQMNVTQPMSEEVDQTALDGKVNDTGDTMTGDLTIFKATPSLYIDKAASGQDATLYFRTAGLNRWRITSDLGAESAGAGSVFRISRYDDAGTLIDNPIVINRSTGAFTVQNLGSAGAVTSNAAVRAYIATAIPAGGTAGAGFSFSTTANFGVFFGSGAPSLSAAKGSLYLRSDGSTTNDRMYVNTNGSTTWTAVTTVA